MIVTAFIVSNFAYGQITEIIFDKVQQFQNETLNINDTRPGEVEVTCTPKQMCITFGNNNEFFSRDVIAQNGYSAENFKIESECAFDRALTAEKSEYCMRSNCTFTDGFFKNGSHVTFRSKLQTSNNYQQVLLEAKPSNQIEINFQCSYPLEVLLATDFKLDYQQITITEEGLFAARMWLYSKRDFSDDSVITNTSIALNGKDELGNTNRISAEINLNSREKSGMMVELRDCWATPDSDPYNIERVVLIRKGCPVNESFTGETLNVIIHNSAENHYTRFSHDIFAFSSSTEVHLHCKIEVCLDTWCNTVQENCANLQSQELLRKRRAINGEVQKVTELVISASPAFTYDYQDPSLRFVDGHRNGYDKDVVRQVVDSSGSIAADFLSVSLLSALAAMATLLIALFVRVVQRSRRFEKM